MTMATQDVVSAIVGALDRANSASNGVDALNVICGAIGDDGTTEYHALVFVADKLAQDIEAIQVALERLQPANAPEAAEKGDAS